MSTRSVATAAFLALAIVGAVPTAHADTAAGLAASAMRECEQGQVAATRALRIEHYERGQKLAEQAVALDDQNAAAHFAIFCNLGEMQRIDGEKISSVLTLRTVIRELDRTLELDPDHLDALSSKGVLLIRLPTLLGGDPRRGEEMLERVVREDPTCVTARLTLADIYAERGARNDAVVLAAQARELARTCHRDDKVAKAEAALVRLKAEPDEIIASLAVTDCPGQPGQRCPPKLETATRATN